MMKDMHPLAGSKHVTMHCSPLHVTMHPQLYNAMPASILQCLLRTMKLRLSVISNSCSLQIKNYSSSSTKVFLIQSLAKEVNSLIQAIQKTLYKVQSIILAIKNKISQTFQ